MAVSSGCSRWSRTGDSGDRGETGDSGDMASLGGTVRGERRARAGLWRMGEGRGWYGDEGVLGSDWT